MSMNRRTKLFLAPLWQYLNQPISNDQSVWNLKYFWYLYKVKLLYKCWQKECSPKSSPHS